MQKLRAAAVVAAMVGSVSMFGAGIASAGGPGLPTVACEQSANTAVTSTETGEAGDVATGGDANSRATQQICGLGNDDNSNTAGDATGGAGGGEGGIALDLLGDIVGG